HVERRESLVDEGRELRGQRRLLDVVFSLEEVDGIGVPGLNLLAEIGWSSCRHDHGRPKGLHYTCSADLQVCPLSKRLQNRGDDALGELGAQALQRIGVLAEVR